MADTWWREGVLYQVYPRSFADSNGDGVGDLAGLIDRLDHLEWLGIDGIWLNPTMPSPNADWGYDVADYRGVHPELGTMADLDRLVAAGAARGIRILLDLVPNHTSDRHPWFVEARAGTAARRHWYVWADPMPDGSPPNDWVSVFDGPAWTLDETSGRYYLHQFLAEQPDLNWWNDEVRDAFDDILRFWFTRGIAGFRIDVAHAIVKDSELRDDPAVTEDDHPEVQKLGLRGFLMNRPEVHEVLQRWRALSDAHDPRARSWGRVRARPRQLIPYYGKGDDQLHLAFNFLFVHAELERNASARSSRASRRSPHPVLAGLHRSNDDAACSAALGDDERRARVALMLLRCADARLSTRGRPCRKVPIDAGGGARPRSDAARHPRLADPRRLPHADAVVGRPGGGFTTADAMLWLLFGDLRGEQRGGAARPRLGAPPRAPT